MVVPWCPPTGESFFLSLTQQETGSGRGRTTQRGRFHVIPYAPVHTRMGRAPLLGLTLAGGVGRLLVCGGLSHP